MPKPKKSNRDSNGGGIYAAKTFAAGFTENTRVGFARAFTGKVIQAYWDALTSHHECGFQITKAPHGLLSARLPAKVENVAKGLGTHFATLPCLDAGYRIGCIYTASLPVKYRSEFGAYYTPPALSYRLIEMTEEAGIDWKTCHVLDGSCGGAAFLAPVALRILREAEDMSPKAILRMIAKRVRGFEIDPFAAWMSQVLVEAALLTPCMDANERLAPLVEVCDSLEKVVDEDQRFDLVIGNPPYGRTKLDFYQRVRFARSLYGHANLYGVFTHAALGWLKDDGIIAYVTPTSMLGGQYYKALRGLLAEEAPPRIIDFVTEREGVFEDVLQETMLAVYQRNRVPKPVQVHFLEHKESEVVVNKSGVFNLPEVGSHAWIIPRVEEHSELVSRLEKLPNRLADYGYGVSTGPLVWNRHKGQFHRQFKPGMHPVIWAESVSSSGKFEWKSEKRSHLPWFKPREKDQWVITHKSCVLVQRTTAKEQSRRLIVAELGRAFVKHHKGVIVENHLNMVLPIVRKPLVSPAVITALLKSSVMDAAFRCINGSVAVSAYELESLPLPYLEDALRLERLIDAGTNPAEVEQAIERIYLGFSDATATTA
jgi:adenine-specific DNA-methyltransferase